LLGLGSATAAVRLRSAAVLSRSNILEQHA
jgi:hypothetical protein